MTVINVKVNLNNHVENISHAEASISTPKRKNTRILVRPQ